MIERMNALFAADPKAALRAYIDERTTQFRSATIHQTNVGFDGSNYASYRKIGSHQLDGREYEVVMVNDGLGIVWLDRVYDQTNLQHVVVPKGSKVVFDRSTQNARLIPKTQVKAEDDQAK